MISDSYSADSQQSNQTSNPLPELNSLGPDLIELILSHLSITSIIQASSVCKSWYSIISSTSFKTQISDSNSFPWFFICGKSWISTNTYPYVFCPEFNKWIVLHRSTVLCTESFTASKGLFFKISPENFYFRPAFSKTWQEIARLKFSSHEHLIGTYNDPDFPDLIRFFVVGSASRVPVSLVSGPSGDMPVNIYNPRSGFWETCPPPPQLSISLDISDALCLALFRNTFYLHTIGSGFILSFDLKTRSWSNIRHLGIEAMNFSYLFSCEHQLVLAGFHSVNGETEFNLWMIDETTFELTKIGIMPEELLCYFFGSEKERTYVSLECVGSGNVVYVFSRQTNVLVNVLACVCEISNSGNCTWRRIPELVGTSFGVCRVMSSCCCVSVKDIYP